MRRRRRTRPVPRQGAQHRAADRLIAATPIETARNVGRNGAGQLVDALSRCGRALDARGAGELVGDGVTEELGDARGDLRLEQEGAAQHHDRTAGEDEQRPGAGNAALVDAASGVAVPDAVLAAVAGADRPAGGPQPGELWRGRGTVLWIRAVSGDEVTAVPVSFDVDAPDHRAVVVPADASPLGVPLAVAVDREVVAAVDALTDRLGVLDVPPTPSPFDDDWPESERPWWPIALESDAARLAIAIHDDGIVTFRRCAQGTHVSIVGRQLFVLPPFWQAMNLDLNPGLKDVLVTQAYKLFFDRSLANLEAVAEGRDVRVGRAWHQPAGPHDHVRPPVRAVEEGAQRVAERARGLLGKFSIGGSPHPEAPQGRVDADGFVHMKATPAQLGRGFEFRDGSVARDAAGIGQVADFLAGYAAAVQRDLAGLR